MATTTDAEQPRSPWNSLEVAKLIASAGIAVAIFVGSLLFQNSARKQAEETARYSKVLEKRTQLWDQMGPMFARLNLLAGKPGRSAADIQEIAQLRDQTTQIIVAYQLYFSPQFIQAIEGFDDILDRRLAGKPTQLEVRDYYKCVRRAAAKDLGIHVDPVLVRWELGLPEGSNYTDAEMSLYQNCGLKDLQPTDS